MPLIGGIDELFLIGNDNVIAENTIEHVAEQIELTVGFRIGSAGCIERLPGATRRDRAHGDKANRPEELHAFHFLASFRLPTHQGAGSTALPFLRNSM